MNNEFSAEDIVKLYQEFMAKSGDLRGLANEMLVCAAILAQASHEQGSEQPVALGVAALGLGVIIADTRKERAANEKAMVDLMETIAGGKP